MRYRSEIDGLRAVAVVPVILFHAGFKTFSGGFVGVDIFFVISGYLITLILLEEIERGDFSLTRFYERRARRILPALFLVMACCLPFAWLWMIPDQLRDFGRSIVAVVFFVSNFLFWREDISYFAAAAELKPLLHTWSLAVEEQYYLFAPLSFAALWRFGRSTVFWAVVGTAVASLILAEWGWRHEPSENFYLLPFRVWELLAGSIAAFIAAGRTPRPSNLPSLAGLGLILFSIFFYDRYIPFPSVYALVPVGGAVLILMYAHAGTLVARLLSTRVLVGIGLISYSAYLWHQPLFAFARIRSMAEPSDTVFALLAGLSLVLAYFSWRFVEQPFRRRPIPLLPSRRVVFAAGTVGGVVFASFGLYASVSGGIPSRLAHLDLSPREASLLESFKLTANKCVEEDWLQRAKLCEVFAPEHPKLRILIIGDSHAGALLPAFRAVGQDNTVYHLGLGGCPPINRSFVRGANFDASLCRQATRDQVEAVRRGGFDVVVLAARWSLYNAGGFVLARDGDPVIASKASAQAAFAALMPETVKDYLDLGVAVVLIEQIPEQGVPPYKIIQQAVLLGIGNGLSEEQFEGSVWDTSRTVEEEAGRQSFSVSVLEKLRRQNVWVLSFNALFERDGRYLWGDRNGSFYRDLNHLSAYGGKLLEPGVTAAFAEIEASLRHP